MFEQELVKTDVLIIGAGIAGIRAAIEAHDQGVNVVLTTKGQFGKDGAAAWMGGQGYQAAMYPPDSLEEHVKDTIVGGKYLNNQELVRSFLELAPASIEDLARWGVRFGKKEGKYVQCQLPGETYGRSVTHVLTGESHGGQLRRALPYQVLRRKKILVMEDMLIIDLLKSNDTVVGAVGLDVREGRFKIFNAKSTILATGGYMGCFDFTTANPTLIGDGHGIAYRAGVEMVNMEFIQFYPYVTLWPPAVYKMGWPIVLLAFLRGYFYNKLGERFMEKYAPVEKDFATREAVARAIYGEVREGRGSPHGGAYLSFSHLPKNLVENVLDELKGNEFLVRLKEVGFDLSRDAIEVAPAAHYTQGGCWIDQWCKTNLPGLYAIGELGSGGKDGADRLAGNSFPFCMAMGYVGGHEAAIRAKDMEIIGIDDNQVKETCEGALSFLERSSGPRPQEVKHTIRKLMSAYMIYARREDELQVGIKEVEKIRRELLPKLRVQAQTRRFNLEWVDALEARNMVCVSEMAMKSALVRKETRGLHDRADFPNEDPEWLKHTTIRNVNNEMVLASRPVTFPYLKPEGKITERAG